MHGGTEYTERKENLNRDTERLEEKVNKEIFILHYCIIVCITLVLANHQLKHNHETCGVILAVDWYMY